MKRDYLVLDTETTGLDNKKDEIVEISIINQHQDVLLDVLLRPTRHDSWKEAQAIHGICPKDVAGAPTLEDISEKIKEIFSRYNKIVIYNAGYDVGFIEHLIPKGTVISCAMKRFAKYYGKWNSYYGNHTWISLVNATDHIKYEFKPHRALEDCKATRALVDFLEFKEVSEVSYRFGIDVPV